MFGMIQKKWVSWCVIITITTTIMFPNRYNNNNGKNQMLVGTSAMLMQIFIVILKDKRELVCSWPFGAFCVSKNLLGSRKVIYNWRGTICFIGSYKGNWTKMHYKCYLWKWFQKCGGWESTFICRCLWI
jgi:hypothetical protein